MSRVRRSVRPVSDSCLRSAMASFALPERFAYLSGPSESVPGTFHQSRSSSPRGSFPSAVSCVPDSSECRNPRIPLCRYRQANAPSCNQCLRASGLRLVGRKCPQPVQSPVAVSLRKHHMQLIVPRSLYPPSLWQTTETPYL